MSNGKTLLANEKFSDLISLLTKAESAVLAFSGGVDSSFLLKAMKLAGMRILAVTAVSETMPHKDFLDSESTAKEIGVELRIIKTQELLNESFAGNPPDRCFFCKDELFKELKAIASENDYRFIFDGSNKDDQLDYRPGRKAAMLHEIRSPLAECNISKEEIREFSKELGLKTWDKPSSPCLSSRFPYGSRISAGALVRVEKAETYLKTLGLTDVRVRDHGDLARIEVNKDKIHMLAEPGKRNAIVAELKYLGFKFISLDLEGYKSGSMNRVLDKKDSIQGKTA